MLGKADFVLLLVLGVRWCKSYNYVGMPDENPQFLGKIVKLRGSIVSM